MIPVHFLPAAVESQTLPTQILGTSPYSWYLVAELWAMASYSAADRFEKQMSLNPC